MPPPPLRQRRVPTYALSPSSEGGDVKDGRRIVTHAVVDHFDVEIRSSVYAHRRQRTDLLSHRHRDGSLCHRARYVCGRLEVVKLDGETVEAEPDPAAVVGSSDDNAVARARNG